MQIVHIYKITNITNGIIYIGQTTQTVRKRWKRHVYDSLVKGKTQPLYDAIREHGESSFVVEEVGEGENQEWGDYLETLYIKIYDSTDPTIGYNRTLGGRTGRHLEETKERIGIKSKEWWADPENKERASKSRKGLLVGERNPMFGKGSFTGRKHSDQTKQKISETRIELFQDPEFKARMSEANKGKHHTPEGRANIAKGSTGNHKLGTKQREESKAKTSATMKAIWAQRRLDAQKEAA